MDHEARLRELEHARSGDRQTIQYLKELYERIEAKADKCAAQHPETTALVAHMVNKISDMQAATRTREDVDRADDAAAADRKALWGKVNELEKFKWKLVGFAAGGGFAGAGVVEGLTRLFGGG